METRLNWVTNGQTEVKTCLKWPWAAVTLLFSFSINPISIWSLTIVTIARIIAITENIRWLRSSQLLKFDFHIVAGIVQIAGHIQSLWSLRSLRSLCYGFHMIAGIVMIVTFAAVAALVVSINFCDRWRSFTITTIAEIDSDSIPAIMIIAIVGSRWDHWRSLAKWKFGFHMIVMIAEQFTSDPSDPEGSPTIIWKPCLSCQKH